MEFGLVNEVIGQDVHTGVFRLLSSFYCFIHNVSADASFGLLQVFFVELRSLYRTLNWILSSESQIVLILLTITEYKYWAIVSIPGYLYL